MKDMTVTLMGSRRPRKLLGYLREACGYGVEERGSGIYEVTGELCGVQIVVMGELGGEGEWLRDLRGGLKGEELGVILEKVRKITDPGLPVSAYTDRILQANEEAVKELRMSRRGFDKLMEEWGLAAKWEERGREEGLEQGLAKGLEKGRQEAAAEYAEQIRRLEEENRRLREGR